jgi:PI31 proteasome regulator N-terminal
VRVAQALGPVSHTFLDADDVDSAPEVSLQSGWDEGHLLQLLYRSPSKKVLEVKVLQMGDSAMVHWGCAGSSIHSVEVSTQEFVTDEMEGAAAFKKDKLKELIDKFAAGLELTAQVCACNCPTYLSRSAVTCDVRHALLDPGICISESKFWRIQDICSPSLPNSSLLLTIHSVLQGRDGTAASQDQQAAASSGGTHQPFGGVPREDPAPDRSGGMEGFAAPASVGQDDLWPAGIGHHPAMGPGIGVGAPSGSQVGPGHPMFQGGNDGRPGPLEGGASGGGFGRPGIRFDPIGALRSNVCLACLGRQGSHHTAQVPQHHGKGAQLDP